MTHIKLLSIYEKVSEILNSLSHQNGTVCLRHGFRLKRISHDQDVTSKYLRMKRIETFCTTTQMFQILQWRRWLVWVDF